MRPAAQAQAEPAQANAVGNLSDHDEGKLSRGLREREHAAADGGHLPAMTRRIEGAVLNRRATMATTTSTAISSRSVWIVAVTGHTHSWPRRSSFQDRPESRTD